MKSCRFDCLYPPPMRKKRKDKNNGRKQSSPGSTPPPSARYAIIPPPGYVRRASYRRTPTIMTPRSSPQANRRSANIRNHSVMAEVQNNDIKGFCSYTWSCVTKTFSRLTCSAPPNNGGDRPEIDAPAQVRGTSCSKKSLMKRLPKCLRPNFLNRESHRSVPFIDIGAVSEEIMMQPIVPSVELTVIEEFETYVPWVAKDIDESDSESEKKKKNGSARKPMSSFVCSHCRICHCVTCQKYCKHILLYSFDVDVTNNFYAQALQFLPCVKKTTRCSKFIDQTVVDVWFEGPCSTTRYTKPSTIFSLCKFFHNLFGSCLGSCSPIKPVSKCFDDCNGNMEILDCKCVNPETMKRIRRARRANAVTDQLVLENDSNNQPLSDHAIAINHIIPNIIATTNTTTTTTTTTTVIIHRTANGTTPPPPSAMTIVNNNSTANGTTPPSSSATTEVKNHATNGANILLPSTKTKVNNHTTNDTTPPSSSATNEVKNRTTNGTNILLPSTKTKVNNHNTNDSTPPSSSSTTVIKNRTTYGIISPSSSATTVVKNRTTNDIISPSSSSTTVVKNRTTNDIISPSSSATTLVKSRTTNGTIPLLSSTKTKVNNHIANGTTRPSLSAITKVKNRTTNGIIRFISSIITKVNNRTANSTTPTTPTTMTEINNRTANSTTPTTPTTMTKVNDRTANDTTPTMHITMTGVNNHTITDNVGLKINAHSNSKTSTTIDGVMVASIPQKEE